MTRQEINLWVSSDYDSNQVIRMSEPSEVFNVIEIEQRTEV